HALVHGDVPSCYLILRHLGEVDRPAQPAGLTEVPVTAVDSHSELLLNSDLVRFQLEVRLGRPRFEVSDTNRSIVLGDELVNVPADHHTSQLDLEVQLQALSGCVVVGLGDIEPVPASSLRPDVRLVRSEEHTSELQSRENLVCR